MELVVPEGLPRFDTVSIDSTVVGFTLLLMIVVTCVLGLLPALRASRPDLMSVLRPGGRVGTRLAGKAVEFRRLPFGLRDAYLSSGSQSAWSHSARGTHAQISSFVTETLPVGQLARPRRPC